MKEYVMTLVGVSLITGIVGMLCPKIHQKYLRLLCGFCVIAAMVAPLPSYLAEADASLLGIYDENGNEKETVYEEIYQETLLNADADRIEYYVKTLLISEFSVESDRISVSVELSQEENTVAIKNIMVALSGSAVLEDPHQITYYLESMLHCPCEIVYR